MSTENSITEQDGVLVVHVMADSCGGVWSLVEPRIAAGCREVVLDFAAVDYLNSMNIAGIITLRNKLQQYGARLELANLQQQVVSILRVLKLERLFTLDRDLPGALSAVKG